MYLLWWLPIGEMPSMWLRNATDTELVQALEEMGKAAGWRFAIVPLLRRKASPLHA